MMITASKLLLIIILALPCGSMVCLATLSVLDGEYGSTGTWILLSIMLLGLTVHYLKEVHDGN